MKPFLLSSLRKNIITLYAIALRLKNKYRSKKQICSANKITHIQICYLASTQMLKEKFLLRCISKK